MKNVLLIGDSIRLGYQQRVAELLGDEVHILAPGENCRFTKYCLWGMHAWMEGWGNPKIDLVHWNTGIWDLHRATADGELFSSVEEYVRDNERMYKQMRSYSDKLVWATIIPGGEALNQHAKVNALVNSEGMVANIYLCATQKEWNEDVCRYNEAARRMYESHGVVINDLYNTLLPHLDTAMASDGLHPNEQGLELLAQQVASVIRTQLAL
ncbi:MAG: SGNH/GDSL hydrolase family protein [Clostridia bacterium]|nr:SGNH/GDSL hydrolase family protein [Clostridia bacterium]